MLFWCNNFSFESIVEYLAWILSYGQLSSIIYEKKLNFGLIALNTDLKVAIFGVTVNDNEEAKETLGSFKLLLRRPVIPISLVD